MADVGNFDTIDDTEAKVTYTREDAVAMYRVFAPYRDKLRRESLESDVNGRVFFPLKMDGMWAVATTPDNTALPVAQDPTRALGQIQMVTFTTAIQIGLQASVLMKDSKGALSPGGIKQDRTESAMEELASYINRVYAGSNRGRLAVVESDGTSNFVAAKPWIDNLLEVNMRLEAYTALLGGSVRDSFSNHRITAIDRDTHTVTYISATTGAADDRALVAGDSIFIAGTYGNAPVGLPDIADDGTNKATIYTLSRTTYPKMKGVVFGNGGTLRLLSQDLMIQACDRIAKFVRIKATQVFMGRGLYRSLSNSLNLDRHFDGNGSNPLKRPMGYDKDSFTLSTFDSNVRFSVDDDITPRTCFVLAWQAFFLCEPMKLDWLNNMGLLPTTGGWIAGMGRQAASVENQGNNCPMGQVRIEDCIDPEIGD